MNNLAEFNDAIKKTRELLQENDEWIKRYSKYAEVIQGNLDFIKQARSTFRQWDPLMVYMNVTNAKNAKSYLKVELRYLGQTVAELKSDKNGLFFIDSYSYDEKNQRDFDCEIRLRMQKWDGEQAKSFRSYFKDRKRDRSIENTNKGNEEHRIESLLITTFSKHINNIKPVTIGNNRFPMPTPLSASDHSTIEYSNFHGGGIDLLTRTGTGGLDAHLCIMELKDENVRAEPPRDALKQALVYTAFIRELLRSEAGQAWWKLFGFSKRVPKKMMLYAACVMPSNHNNDKSFRDMELNIDGDIIKLHYLYFIENNNQITDIDTSMKLVLK